MRRRRYGDGAIDECWVLAEPKTDGVPVTCDDRELVLPVKKGGKK